MPKQESKTPHLHQNTFPPSSTSTLGKNSRDGGAADTRKAGQHKTDNRACAAMCAPAHSRIHPVHMCRCSTRSSTCPSTQGSNTGTQCMQYSNALANTPQALCEQQLATLFKSSNTRHQHHAPANMRSPCSVHLHVNECMGPKCKARLSSSIDLLEVTLRQARTMQRHTVALSCELAARPGQASTARHSMGLLKNLPRQRGPSFTARPAANQPTCCCPCCSCREPLLLRCAPTCTQPRRFPRTRPSAVAAGSPTASVQLPRPHHQSSRGRSRAATCGGCWGSCC